MRLALCAHPDFPETPGAGSESAASPGSGESCSWPNPGRLANSLGVPAVPYRSARHLPEPPNEPRDAVRAAAAVLRAGGLVAFPTETVYGLGADARSASAVAGVYAAKGRPSINPLIVHVTGEAMARRCAAVWPAEAALLAEAFWPGPLSIIVPRAEVISEIVTGGGAGVALRCPNHPMALALLFEFDGPLVGPSANKSGRVSPTTAAHVRGEFGAETVPPILVLDGGACAAGIESTVVSLLNDEVRVLRPGVIGPEAIAAVLGRPVLMGATGVQHTRNAGEAMASPGMLASHYAPNAPAQLVTEAELVVVLNNANERWAVISHVSVPPTAARVMQMPETAMAYAKAIYNALREADGSGLAIVPRGAAATERIVIVLPPQQTGNAEEDAVWQAICDRLMRACAAR